MAEKKNLVAAGKSQTMNSKHLPQADGYSHAVDLVAYIKYIDLRRSQGRRPFIDGPHFELM